MASGTWTSPVSLSPTETSWASLPLGNKGKCSISSTQWWLLVHLSQKTKARQNCTIHCTKNTNTSPLENLIQAVREHQLLIWVAAGSLLSLSGHVYTALPISHSSTCTWRWVGFFHWVTNPLLVSGFFNYLWWGAEAQRNRSVYLPVPLKHFGLTLMGIQWISADRFRHQLTSSQQEDKCLLTIPPSSPGWPGDPV